MLLRIADRRKLDHFQAWKPSMEEAASCGCDIAQISMQRMLGGPNPTSVIWTPKAVPNGRILRSSSLQTKLVASLRGVTCVFSSGTEFQRAVVQIQCLSDKGELYMEYGVPFRFLEISPFANASPILLAQCRLFNCYHNNSGPWQRTWMRGSDLTLVSHLELREGDQFTKITQIQNSVYTLNPRRDCDQIHDKSSWVLLQFSESRQVILDECVSDNDNE